MRMIIYKIVKVIDFFRTHNTNIIMKPAVIGGVLALVLICIIVMIYYMGDTTTNTVAYVPAVDAKGTPAAVGVNVATSGTPAQQSSQVAETQAAINNCQLPAGIADGDIIRCATTGGIYKVVGCKKQWYPNPTIYAKYGNPAFKNVDCAKVDAIANGPSFERFSAPMVTQPMRMSEMSNLSSVFK